MCYINSVYVPSSVLKWCLVRKQHCVYTVYICAGTFWDVWDPSEVSTSDVIYGIGIPVRNLYVNTQLKQTKDSFFPFSFPSTYFLQGRSDSSESRILHNSNWSQIEQLGNLSVLMADWKETQDKASLFFQLLPATLHLNSSYKMVAIIRQIKHYLGSSVKK